MDRRKGFTLMEMSIVLFLVVIIGSMVVSFSIMMNRRVNANGDKLNLIQETDDIETVLENWIEDRIGEGAVFSIVEGKLNANVDGVNHVALIEDNSFLLKVGDDVKTSIELEIINELQFSIENKGERQIFICSASYELNEQVSNYTFTIYSRVGQTIVGGGA